MTARFRRVIASHNRHVIVSAALSLAGAWLAWMIAHALVVGLSLGVLTIVRGQEVIAGEALLSLPPWLHSAALGLALTTLVWEAAAERRARFRPASDRPVIGWHLFGDVVLLPARLTFSIGHQLASLVVLGADGRRETLALLRHIRAVGRCPAHSLGAIFPDRRMLEKSLFALQVLGWIDLLRAGDGWDFILRSSASGEIAAMFDDEIAAQDKEDRPDDTVGRDFTGRT
jgi:hypothetical protein